MITYLFPNYISKFDIYDIFYSDGNIIIISPQENKQLNIELIDTNNKKFEVIIDPHKHTFIYKIISDYKNIIKISIDGETFETYVNKYTSFENKILMSTIVKDEDEYIVQWINYHNKLGIDNFIIYDNSEKNTLINTLKEFIENGIVLLIKWIYPYRLPKSGLSAQPTQQNHSIYAFRNSKYIGLFDIDEYINPQNNYTNINCLIDDIIKNNNIDVSTIGSFRLLNKLFYNPHNLSTTNYNFLKIYNCDNILHHEREKNFVIPKNINTFSVHMITSGKPMYTINQHFIYFNHYYFLNKTERGKKLTNLIDDSIINKLTLLNIY